MPFIVDDIAVAALSTEAATAATESAIAVEAATTTTAIEAATASESTIATEATTALDDASEGYSLTDISTIEGGSTSPKAEPHIDLSNVTFVDEYPVTESFDIPSEIEGTDGNVFYDIYPSESNSPIENIPETHQEINIPKSYEELCATRDCGGSYKDLRNQGWGWSDNPPHEVHHMPADSASPLEREEGPAIAIDYTDHQQTASCGSSREAKEYRAEQKELIDNGKFLDAIQMDIDDLHDKFGDKYNEAISQMLDYVNELELAGKI